MPLPHLRSATIRGSKPPSLVPPEGPTPRKSRSHSDIQNFKSLHPLYETPPPKPKRNYRWGIVQGCLFGFLGLNYADNAALTVRVEALEEGRQSVAAGTTIPVQQVHNKLTHLTHQSKRLEERVDALSTGVTAVPDQVDGAGDEKTQWPHIVDSKLAFLIEKTSQIENATKYLWDLEAKRRAYALKPSNSEATQNKQSDG